jgi:heme-degrading monooxygenase HmoA
MNEEKRIVAVVTFKITPEDFARVSSEAGTTLQRRLPTIPGFIEGMVCANEGKTKIGIVSEWKSRQNWAAAQWDDDIERAVADMFQDTASYELEMYFPLARATSATAK